MFFVGVFLWMNRQSITVSPLVSLLILLVAAYPSGPKGVVLAYILVLILIFCTVAFLPTFSFFEKIGDFSYGIYLWGWPIQQMLKHRYADMSSHSNAIVASIICVIIGAISWYFLEKPALTLKDRILGWKVFSYFKR
jgi:peptidoglycan/LPS O-acetylase OafA/YrhL